MEMGLVKAGKSTSDFMSFSIFPLLLCLVGITSGQIQKDTIQLLKPFPDYSIQEDSLLEINYSAYLKVQINQGSLRFTIEHEWGEKDPGFDMMLDTSRKRLLLHSSLPYWGKARVKLYYVSTWESLDSTDIDEFIVQYKQVKDDPVYYNPIPGDMTEDVNQTVDLNQYFFDYDNLRPYRYSVAKKSESLDISLSGSMLTLKPKPDYFGYAEFTISAKNTLDSQLIQTVELFVKSANDAPRLIIPLRDTSLPFLDSLVMEPFRYFRDVDDSMDTSQRHTVTLEVDTNYMEAKGSPSTPWILRSKGSIGNFSISIKAIDPLLGAFTTKAQLQNNGAWPLERNMLLNSQTLPSFDYYPARTKLAWVDPGRNILRVATDRGNMLLDSHRRLLVPPFDLKSGTCLVAEPPSLNVKGESVPGKIWFIGEADWPKGIKNSGEAGVAHEWAYRSVKEPLYTNHLDNACTYDRPSPGSAFRVLRWSKNSVGVYRFENDIAGKESRLEAQDEIQFLDVVPLGSKIIVLRMVTQYGSVEREVLWIDTYDASDIEQTFSKTPVSQLISIYQPFEGKSNLVSRITSGKLWNSGKGIEVFWTKVDRVNADDFFPVYGSTCLFRTAFDSSLIVKAARVRINQEFNNYAQDLYIVGIDLIGPSEARVYWTLNDGSCGDIGLESARIDLSKPSQNFPVNSIPTRSCGAVLEHPFSLPFHFGDGNTTITFGRDIALRKYLRFSSASPVVLQNPGKASLLNSDKVSREKGMNWGIVKIRGKSFNLLGQPVNFQR